MDEIPFPWGQTKNALFESRHALLLRRVNPHFLFNSLSVLSSLVRKDPDRAEQFIRHLAKVYRYILEERSGEMALLRQELTFLQSYVFLLKTRFDAKLEVVVQIEDALLDQRIVAPLTLQILIENAIKHNRMSEKTPLSVSLEVDGDYLVVRNTLQPRVKDPYSACAGLQDMIDGYALLTARPIMAGKEDGAFVVRVPLIPKSNA